MRAYQTPRHISHVSVAVVFEAVAPKSPGLPRVSASLGAGTTKGRYLVSWARNWESLARWQGFAPEQLSQSHSGVRRQNGSTCALLTRIDIQTTRYWSPERDMTHIRLHQRLDWSRKSRLRVCEKYTTYPYPASPPTEPEPPPKGLWAARPVIIIPRAHWQWGCYEGL